jgi:hypothetical protein
VTNIEYGNIDFKTSIDVNQIKKLETDPAWSGVEWSPHLTPGLIPHLTPSLMLFNFEFEVTVFDVPVFDVTFLYRTAF